MDRLQKLLDLLQAKLQASSALLGASPGTWNRLIGNDHAPFVLAAAGTILVLGMLAWFWHRSRRNSFYGPELTRNEDEVDLRACGLVGREAEQRRLRDFLDAPVAFAWLQLAGASGQGKSRLATELIEWAGRHGWEAGLLENAALDSFSGQWEHWHPHKPYLLVIDSLLERSAQIRPMLLALARHSGELRKRARVRILLLERQRWDLGEFPPPASEPRERVSSFTRAPRTRSNWFSRLVAGSGKDESTLLDSRFDTGVIELGELDEETLLDIVRKSARALQRDIELPEDTQLGVRLARIDPAGRPLYAILLGRALAAGAVTEGWERDDLLQATFERERDARWEQTLEDVPPALGQGGIAERIAVAATITGGLDCVESARRELVPTANVHLRLQALVLTNGCLDSGATGPSRFVPPARPALPAEWFVLTAFANGAPLEYTLDGVWCLAPHATAAFLQRIAGDFPEHPVTRRMIERTPPDETSREALNQVSGAIMGYLLQAGQPIPEQIMQAQIEAAGNGDPAAMFDMAECYRTGLAVPQDAEQAYQWFLQGAEARHGPSMCNAGFCLARGEGVTRDVTAAARWFHKGARAGDSTAMRNLGICYAHGQGIAQDPAEALRWYRQSCEAGNSRARVNLGHCYESGIGVAANPMEAVHLYQQAAESGEGLAMTALGFCYQRGDGVAQDQKQAVYWFRQGATAGDCRAMAALGICYDRGAGVTDNPKQAAHWFRQSAERGDSQAMFALASCYARGRGTQLDPAKAAHWFRQSAETGNIRAMTALGLCYAQGEGVAEDLAEAVHWLRKSADAGDTKAQQWLCSILSAVKLTRHSQPVPELAGSHS